MKSMTGFAQAQCVLGNRKLTIEIKTLNSKALDIIFKAPSTLRSKELEIRSMISRLERGKIEIYITEELDNTSSTTLNEALVSQRYQQISGLAQNLNCGSEHILNTILSMSDVWDKAETADLTDEDWAKLAACVNAAIDEVEHFRKHEGEILKLDFVKHINLIEQKLNQIPAFESERIDTAKDRIRKFLAEAAVKDVDENRFEQELIYYLEKLDITEEKIRLQKHLDYFRQTMEQEEGSGKKLGFIAQEMGREINTTGSKANHVEIQKLVVEMKDELEKIKEQLGNIL